MILRRRSNDVLSVNNSEPNLESYTVNFNNPHVMTVYPKEERSKCGYVYYSQPVGLARLEWECCILVKPNSRSGTCR